MVKPAFPVVPGDYKLKLLRESRQKPYQIDQAYEMLMPDGATRYLKVSGVGSGICSAAASN